MKNKLLKKGNITQDNFNEDQWRGFFSFFSGEDCISNSETFEILCLRKEVLENTITAINELAGETRSFENKNYRYASYWQFIWWIYTKLGKGVRRVIPSCVVLKICQNFPEDSDQYVPYKQGRIQTWIGTVRPVWAPKKVRPKKVFQTNFLA